MPKTIIIKIIGSAEQFRYLKDGKPTHFDISTLKANTEFGHILWNKFGKDENMEIKYIDDELSLIFKIDNDEDEMRFNHKLNTIKTKIHNCGLELKISTTESD